jgi:hypothetical protein
MVAGKEALLATQSFAWYWKQGNSAARGATTLRSVPLLLISKALNTGF